MRPQVPLFSLAFPLASQYPGAFTSGVSSAVRESRPTTEPHPWSERHLQCVWFDPAFRPASLQTHTGEPVVVETPGEWNLEAGPDFVNASLLVGSGPATRRLLGDVEIHVRPADWQHHGHAGDPRYRRVIAHVTWWPGAAPGLPESAVSIALSTALRHNRAFSFELVDVTEYPWPARAPRPPCADGFSRLTPEEIVAFLESAGEYRLQIKTARFQADTDHQDPHQTLYEELFAALGYKHNRMPFRRLAQRVPLQTLRQYAGHDPIRGYALLAGVSGLLPNRLNARWDDETRTFLRRVWNLWWKLADAWAGHVMDHSEWRLAGVRPLNHPLRRLMAAARLFCGPGSLTDHLLERVNPESPAFLDNLTHLFSNLPEDPYWSWHQGLGGKRTTHPVALIGPDRAAAMAINVAIPFLAACDHLPPAARDLLRTLPPEADHRILRTTAHLLFGRDHSPQLYPTALARQGLVQIFQDFCLQDRTRCQSCPLPRLLASPTASP